MTLLQDTQIKQNEYSKVASSEVKASLADQAYEILKQRILTLEFEPGSYLNESMISEELSISRNPVHNAVKRLVFEGLIDIIPRKGLIVRPLNLTEIIEIADARLVNETYCASKAAEYASVEEIHNMRTILDRASKAISERNVEAQMFLDRDFHCAIFKSARNSVLEEMLRVLHERSLRNWFVSLKEPKQAKKVVAEHTKIVDAIEAGDSNAAKAAMRKHILSSRDNLQRRV